MSRGVNPGPPTRAGTRASLSAISDPLVTFPERSRTLYWKVSGISASHQHPARRAPVGADGRVVAVRRTARDRATEQPLELLGIMTTLEADLLRYGAGLDVLGERHVHRLHPVAATRPPRGGDAGGR